MAERAAARGTGPARDALTAALADPDPDPDADVRACARRGLPT